MKKIISILASAVALLTLSQSAQAQSNTRSIHVSGYSSVTVSSAINIVFDQRFNDSIWVESSSELIDKLEVEVKGSKVSIGYSKAKKGTINANRKSVVYMSAANLSQLTASGENEIVANQPLQGKSLQVKLSGDSRMHGAVETAKFSLKLSKNAVFEGSLSCSDVDVNMGDKSKAVISNGSRCAKLSLSTSGDADFNGNWLEVTSSSKCSLSASSRAYIVMHGDANISTTGAASLYGRLDCKKTSISMGKTSRVSINGSCKALTLKASGNCDFKNPEFIANNSASCTVSGSTSSEIKCNGKVTVKASDSSQINVQGEGTLKIDAKGSSSVLYTEGMKATNTKIKDQASVRSVKPAPAYSPLMPVMPIIQ